MSIHHHETHGLFGGVVGGLDLRVGDEMKVTLPVDAKAMAEVINEPVSFAVGITQETYGYGHNPRKLVVALERGDLITIREQGRRTKHTARLIDVRWWMLRCAADKALMEKLRERKASKAARLASRRQRAAERRLFRSVPQDAVS